MSKIETYCESKFITSLCENYPSDPTDKDHKLWIEIFELINSKSDLIIDSKEILIQAMSNPLIKHIIKSSDTGRPSIHEFSDHFEQIQNDVFYIRNTNNCSPIYLLDKEIPKELEQYGIFVANNVNQYEKFLKLKLEHNIVKVNRSENQNQFYSWHLLFRNKPPINTIIIADNYILDKQESFENNIFEILESLIPSNSIEEVHVAIITKRDLLNPEKKHSIISKFLIDLKVNNFQLGIYLTSTDKPHDRMIISNYFTIVSGHSFNLKNSKGKIVKDTSLIFLPIISKNNVEAYERDLKAMVRYIQNCRVIGDKKNRLLDYYK